MININDIVACGAHGAAKSILWKPEEQKGKQFQVP